MGTRSGTADRARARGASRTGARFDPAWLPFALALGACLVLLATQYHDVLTIDFSNDDYLILDKVRSHSFASLWTTHDLLSGYYRPWSREFHYWLLGGAAHASPAEFHVVSLLLFATAIALFVAFVRPHLGSRVAVTAACFVVAQAAWGTLLVWPAGSQDLWTIVAGLACLWAFASRRPGWALLAFAIALLSKETAATLPLVAFAYALVVGRDTFARALQRTAAFWPVLLAWMWLHPRVHAGLGPYRAPQAVHVLGATVANLANVDVLPDPARGWTAALLRGGVLALGLGAIAVFALRRPRPTPTPHATRFAWWCVVWALLGWLPQLAPDIRWQPYYALWGAFGACAAATALLARAPAAVGVGLLAAIALLRPARADTPQVGLGSEWYQRRAAALTHTLKTDLLRMRPGLPPHSRLFFTQLPSHIGLIASPGYSAQLRVWYADTTLRGYLYSQYAKRAPSDTSGGDFFFESDTLDTGHLTGGVEGPESPSVADLHGDWETRHWILGSMLFRAGDVARAKAEFVKLATAFPDEWQLADNVALCESALGLADSVEWRRRALTLYSRAQR